MFATVAVLTIYVYIYQCIYICMCVYIFWYIYLLAAHNSVVFKLGQANNWLVVAYIEAVACRCCCGT